MSPLLPRIERYRDIWRMHAFKILQKLRNSLARRLVRNNKRIWKIFSKLRCLATRRRCHIKNQEFVFMNLTICQQIHRMRGRKFLNIKIPNQVIHAHTQTAFQWIKIRSTISRKNPRHRCWRENPSIRFQTRFDLIFESWLDTNGS